MRDVIVVFKIKGVICYLSEKKPSNIKFANLNLLKFKSLVFRSVLRVEIIVPQFRYFIYFSIN